MKLLGLGDDINKNSKESLGTFCLSEKQFHLNKNEPPQQGNKTH